MQDFDLFDAARQRAIPTRYYPSVGGSRGWILFSVGFGGERSGYAYLGRSWSGLGFEVVVCEHVGSNLAVLKQLQRPGMRNAELARVVGEKVREPEELRERPLDLLFVRQHFCASSDWVGVGGHSFGSYTALAAMGQPGTGGWKGAVLMSVQPPGSMLAESAFSALHLPVLMLTGTKDSGMPAGVQVEQRLDAYRALPEGQRYLGLIEGADHMSFAAVGLGLEPVLSTVMALTGEFWTAVWEGRPPRRVPTPLEVYDEC